MENCCANVLPLRINVKSAKVRCAEIKAQKSAAVFAVRRANYTHRRKGVFNGRSIEDLRVGGNVSDPCLKGSKLAQGRRRRQPEIVCFIYSERVDADICLGSIFITL